MEFWLQIIVVTAAVLAAIFWLCSALIHIPDTADMKLSGPESPSGYMQRQSKFSAIAAALAAVSASAQAILVYLDMSI